MQKNSRLANRKLIKKTRLTFASRVFVSLIFLILLLKNEGGWLAAFTGQFRLVVHSAHAAAVTVSAASRSWFFFFGNFGNQSFSSKQ